jgi:hypothetical protein
MNSVILLLIFSFCNIPAESLPKFFRGRYFEAPKRNLLSSVAENYFDQRLSHFDESITTTWKQVN